MKHAATFCLIMKHFQAKVLNMRIYFLWCGNNASVIWFCIQYRDGQHPCNTCNVLSPDLHTLSKRICSSTRTLTMFQSKTLHQPIQYSEKEDHRSNQSRVVYAQLKMCLQQAVCHINSPASMHTREGHRAWSTRKCNLEALSNVCWPLYLSLEPIPSHQKVQQQGHMHDTWKHWNLLSSTKRERERRVPLFPNHWWLLIREKVFDKYQAELHSARRKMNATAQFLLEHFNNIMFHFNTVHASFVFFLFNHSQHCHV